MFDRETPPGRVFASDQDYEYGSIEPDGWIVFCSIMEVVVVLITLAVFLFIKVPYYLIKKARNARQ